MKKLRNKKVIYCICCSFIATLFFAFSFVLAKNDVAIAKASASPSELWSSTGSGAIITGNVDVPDIAKSGYIKPNGVMTYAQESDLEDWQKNGVMVSTTSSIDYVEYNNIVDLNGFTKEDKLIDILPISSNPRLEYDFNQMTVKFTDADNEDNWFSVYLTSNAITSAATSNIASAHTWVKVNASNGLSAGYRYGQKNIAKGRRKRK